MLIIFRICDSHNLDVSPLCSLTNGLGLDKWSDTVMKSYGDGNIPQYIKDFSSPTRNVYETEDMMKAEILTALMKQVMKSLH